LTQLVNAAGRASVIIEFLIVVLCSIKSQNAQSAFLMWAYQVVLEKRPLN